MYTPLLGCSFYGRTTLQIPHRANVDYPKGEMEGRQRTDSRKLFWNPEGRGGLFSWLGFFSFGFVLFFNHVKKVHWKFLMPD